VSRSRNLKPGFFKNETLAECDPLARLLFEGLWCEADREGRLEDRPRRLKAEILPYDDCDIERLLGQLSDRGFIERYYVGAERYIAIVNFAKHQNPHVREAESVIPAPNGTEHNLGSARAQPRQCQGDAEHGTSPADSSFPHPSSPIQGERETHATRAGECAKAMREAGCVSINQSNPDFLAALDEGVTPKEFADAVNAHKDEVSGAGLFKYAVKAARTNHAKEAAPVVIPSARAGPGQTQSKTMGAILALQGMKDGLDQTRTADRLSEAPHARLGASAGG